MTTPDDRFVLIMSTAGSDAQAESIARALVERNLAACVNIVGQTCSVYRWEGKVVREEEKLLLIKSAERLIAEVRDTIRELHSYDVPEIIAIPIHAGDSDYMKWLGESLKSDGAANE